MNLQFKFLAVAVILAIVAMWLEGCNYAVIESTPVQITFAGAALAEENFIGRGSRDNAEETTVKDIQAKLVELGYLMEAPDGVFGKNTEGALLRFQAENGLEQTGVVDYATKYRLFSAKVVPMPTPEPEPLVRGSSGEQVALVQEKMRLYGFSTSEVDKSYGADMQNIVKAFQDYAVYHYGSDFVNPEENMQSSITLSPETTPVPVDILIEHAETDYAGYGDVSVELYLYLEDDLFPVYRVDLQEGDSGDDVVRVQNRLQVLGYLYDFEPGVYDDFTVEAVYWFQGKNNLGKNGVADEITQKKLFSEDAVVPEKVDHPYFMRVSLDEQKVYIYRWICGGYNQLIKTMICSTGKAGWETPKGLFHSSGHAGDRWHYFEMNDTYAQYAFNINGNILFHSVLYKEDDEKTLLHDTMNALGSPASHGCVRLKPEDAYWIYWNNKPGAPIEVY